MNIDKTGVKELRSRLVREKRDRAKSALLRMLIWIALPMVLASIYYSVLASPVYTSTVVLGVSSGALQDAQDVDQSLRNAYVVRDLMISHDMLAYLESEQGYSDHYDSLEIDWLSRLSEDAGTEQRFDHYIKHTQFHVDERAQSVTLTVDAYDPVQAQNLSQAVVDEAGRRLSVLDDTVYKDYLNSVTTQTEDAVASITRSPGSAETFDVDVAEEQYQMAVRALASARSMESSHRRQVRIISGPSLPDQPSGPPRLRGVVTVSSFAVCIFVIVSLLVASIRDHARM